MCVIRLDTPLWNLGRLTAADFEINFSRTGTIKTISLKVDLTSSVNLFTPDDEIVDNISCFQNKNRFTAFAVRIVESAVEIGRTKFSEFQCGIVYIRSLYQTFGLVS